MNIEKDVDVFFQCRKHQKNRKSTYTLTLKNDHEKNELACSTTRCLCAPFPFHTTASTMLPSLNLRHRQTERKTDASVLKAELETLCGPSTI